MLSNALKIGNILLFNHQIIPHFNTNETDSILDQEGQTIDRVSVTSLHNIVNDLYSGFSQYGLLRQ